MVVFLHRPSPQLPRPSTRSALAAFAACQYNVQMSRQQIKSRSVETTWVFTQSVFMAINTLLWTLSYEEVRRRYPREEVKTYLDVGLESILLASERWPGAASAHDLYVSLIDAVLKIYEKDGDVQVTGTGGSSEQFKTESLPLFNNTAPSIEPAAPAATRIFKEEEVDPLEQPMPSAPPLPLSAPTTFTQASEIGSSRDTPSAPRLDRATPPQAPYITTTGPGLAPYQQHSSANPPSSSSATLSASQPYGFNLPPTPSSPFTAHAAARSRTTSASPGAVDNLHYFHPAAPPPLPANSTFDPTSPFNQLPTTFAELASWSPTFVLPSLTVNDAGSSNSYLYDPSSYQPSTSAATSPYNVEASQLQYQQHDPASFDAFWAPELLTQGVGGGFGIGQGGNGGPASPGAAAMMGVGLPVERQAGLMESLEAEGMGAIGRMIRESEGFLSGRGG
jgi:hypothetical protein